MSGSGEEQPRSAVSTVLAAPSSERRAAADRLLEEIDSYQAARTVALDLEQSLEAESNQRQYVASLVAARLALEYPEAVVPVVDSLVDRVEEGSRLTAHRCLFALSQLGEANPSVVEPAVPSAAAIVDRDDTFLADAALAFLGTVANEQPEGVEAAVPALVSFLAADDRSAFATPPERLQRGSSRERLLEKGRRVAVTSDRRRDRALDILKRIARAEPQVVAPYVGELADLLADGSDEHRRSLLLMLSALAESDPAAVEEAIEPAGSLLTSETDRSIQTTAVRFLALAAEGHPRDVSKTIRVANLADLLEAADSDARGGAVGVLAYVAEHDPEAVGRMTGRVRSLIDDNASFVRGNAIWTLAALNDRASIAQIEERAQSDPDPEVRTVAAEALDSLTATDVSTDRGREG